MEDEWEDLYIPEQFMLKRHQGVAHQKKPLRKLECTQVSSVKISEMVRFIMLEKLSSIIKCLPLAVDVVQLLTISFP